MAYQKQYNRNTSNQGKEQKKKSLEDYVDVNERIEKFWSLYPDGRIETEIVTIKEGLIIMRAHVYKSIEHERPSASGTAYEREGSNFINETSALENCETSAVGRALAMMGFEIKRGIASRQEIEIAKGKREAMNRKKQEEQAAKQQEPPQTKAAPEDFDENMTPRGREMFHKIRELWADHSGGDFDGFVEWYTKRANAGMNNEKIYLALHQQIEKRREQKQA